MNAFPVLSMLCLASRRVPMQLNMIPFCRRALPSPGCLGKVRPGVVLLQGKIQTSKTVSRPISGLAVASCNNTHKKCKKLQISNL